MVKNHIQSAIAILLITFLGLSITENEVLAESGFEWHVYGTLGFSHTDGIENVEQKNVPYSYLESGASLKPLSKLALQTSYRFTRKLDVTVQAVARGFEDFEPEVEWGYLKYRLLDDLSIRFGRIRRPLFMHSDSYNVAYAYPWSRPPGVTYFEFAGLYQSIDAIDFSYDRWLGSWDFSAQAYYGKGRSDSGFIKNIPTTYTSDDSYGLALEFEKNDFSIQLGHHQAEFSVDIPVSQQAIAGLNQLGFSNLAKLFVIEDKLAKFSSLGGSYRFHNWRLDAELTHLGSDDSILASVSSGYLGISWIKNAYSFNYTIGRHRSKSNLDFVTPINQTATTVGAANTQESAIAAAYLNTIAEGFSEYADSNDNQRTSHSLGLRYDFLKGTAVKFEVERVKDEGTRDHTTNLNISLDFVY